MALETFTGAYINGLAPANPVGSTDTLDEGDNHIRGIKLVLQNTFPNITGAVTATHTELNYLDGVTLGTAVASLCLAVDASKDIGGLNIVTAASFVGPLTGAVTGNVTGDVTGDLTGAVTATGTLADGVTATTQSASDNSTKVATTAYADAGGVTTATSTAYTTYAASTILAAKSHGLGGQPDVVMLVMKCTSTDAGYAVDDYVTLDYSTARGATVWSSATEFGGTVGSSSIRIPHKSTAVDTTIAAGKWSLYIKAIKF